jgi:hypothetical protein
MSKQLMRSRLRGGRYLSDMERKDAYHELCDGGVES